MDDMTVEYSLNYVFVDCATFATAIFSDARLSSYTERHSYKLEADLALTTGQDIQRLVEQNGIAGAVFSLERGVPGHTLLRLCDRILKTNSKVYFYWPLEKAIEVIDAERLLSFRRLWLLARLHKLLRRRPQQTLTEIPINEVRALALRAKPVEFRPTEPIEFHPPDIPTPSAPFDRSGMYVRLDFWAPLSSGGSYGHTVYQVEAISRTTKDFVCILGNRFKLLDALGVRQVALHPALRDGNERNIIDANVFYYERLKPLVEAFRPAFVFERLVLGNYVMARICSELGIPYIAEYNGSEVSMARSFNGQRYAHEEFYLAAEEFSLKQATLISVVSNAVADSVAKRGIDSDRILVNPNAVNTKAYAPASDTEKQALRSKLGFKKSDRVIGFIGTFGGWHGVDILASAMPTILARAPNARFLLIGDGNLKHLVQETVDKHNLKSLVVDVGRVEQEEGSKLLKVCDIFVSPHSSHMLDSKFFGSPTKIFEYMAMSAGIVASDLEQIGEVLTPALHLKDLGTDNIKLTNKRALLCAPGDLDEFVEATLALVADPELSAALGKNAREAAERFYTWDEHVAILWAKLSGEAPRGFHADIAQKSIGGLQ